MTPTAHYIGGQLGHSGKEKNLFSLPGIKWQFLTHPSDKLDIVTCDILINNISRGDNHSACGFKIILNI